MCVDFTIWVAGMRKKYFRSLASFRYFVITYYTGLRTFYTKDTVKCVKMISVFIVKVSGNNSFDNNPVLLSKSNTYL